MRKQRTRTILALLLAGTLLMGLGGCEIPEILVTEPETTVSSGIETAQDAIAQLAEEEAAYGYENALSELTEKSSAAVKGDNYFRLQQNYQGIPVYGRTLVYATDSQGNVTSVTGNVADVDPDVNMTPSVTPEQVQSAISAYMGDVLGIADADVQVSQLPQDDLCIFNMGQTGESCLAYCLWLGEYEFVVDAITGDVLFSALTIYDTAVEGYRASDSEREQPFTVEKYSETEYVLEDKARSLIIKNFNGIASSTTSGNQTVYNWSRATNVVSEDNIFGNDQEKEANYEDGVTLLLNFQKLHDYFRNKLKIEKHSLTGSFVAYYDDGYQNGRNARGGSNNEGNSIITMGSKTGVNDIDVMAHEYMHMISQANVRWTNGSIENYALNEAYSDIYAELAEAYFYQWEKPNWIIDMDAIDFVIRSVKNPSETKNAFNTDGLSGERGTTQKEIKTGGYKYSTVISHAAYLMWNGIDGNEAKKLSCDELAELWYRAMLMMPPDCDFYGCRRLVELAASSMKLTQAQIDCVSQAFNKVGITWETSSTVNTQYEMQPEGKLYIYGANEELYGDCVVAISGNTAIYGPVLGEADNKYSDTFEITSPNSVSLKLPEGIFTFTVTDKANPDRMEVFTVFVHDDGNAKVEIFTNFGDVLVRGTVSEIRRENGVETNVPITHAIAKVYSSQENAYIETIDMSTTQGIFKTELPAGEYIFEVEADGYQSHSYSFILSADNPQYLEIVLQREVQKQLTCITTHEDGQLVMEEYLDYNAFGQITFCRKVWYDGGKVEREQNIRYFYDHKDRLIRVEDEHSDFGHVFVDEYVYDNQDRLITSSTEEEGGWMKMEYEYDSSGRLIRTVEYTDPYTLVTDYVYDAEDRLIGATLNYDSWGDIWTEDRTYTYDSQGRLVRMETTGSDGTNVETYEYDARGRKKKITYQDPWDTWEKVYDYDHSPFVIQNIHDMGIFLTLDGWSLYLGDAQLQYSDDGTPASAEYAKYNRTYTFYYDGTQPEKESSEEWKQLYADYLEEQGKNITGIYQRYALAYVDGDNIPEIFLFSDSVYPGIAILWISEGEVHMTAEIGYGGAAYQEKQGLFATVWMNRGTWGDTVYTLKDGKLTTIHRGRVYSDGDITWDDNPVSQTEYERLYAQAFDVSTATWVPEKGPIGNLTAEILNWK